MVVAVCEGASFSSPVGFAMGDSGNIKVNKQQSKELLQRGVGARLAREG